MEFLVGSNAADRMPKWVANVVNCFLLWCSWVSFALFIPAGPNLFTYVDIFSYELWLNMQSYEKHWLRMMVNMQQVTNFKFIPSISIDRINCFHWFIKCKSKFELSYTLNVQMDTDIKINPITTNFILISELTWQAIFVISQIYTHLQSTLTLSTHI